MTRIEMCIEFRSFTIMEWKPLIVIHPEGYNQALKKIDSEANEVFQNEIQVIEILEYLINK